MELDRRRGARGWCWIGGGGREVGAGSQEGDRGQGWIGGGGIEVGADRRRGHRGRGWIGGGWNRRRLIG